MANSLEELIESNPDPRELKRALAVQMSTQGYTHRQIMPILKVSSGFISKWKQQYESKGIERLKLGYKGSESELSQPQKQEIIQWLREKNYWNLGELQYHLAANYSVSYYSNQSYYDLFKAAGISWKKSQKKIQKKIQN